MKKNKKKKAPAETGAERLTRWVGSPSSVVAHTLVFAASFLVGAVHLADWDTVLLVLTTIVSLEAIYLSIFIQMSVNRNTQSLREVEEDIDVIQEDVEEISEDVEEISEDLEEISEDVGELQEDVEEISEDEKEDEERDRDAKAALDSIHESMKKLMEDIDKLKNRQ